MNKLQEEADMAFARLLNKTREMAMRVEREHPFPWIVIHNEEDVAIMDQAGKCVANVCDCNHSRALDSAREITDYINTCHRKDIVIKRLVWSLKHMFVVFDYFNPHKMPDNAKIEDNTRVFGVEIGKVVKEAEALVNFVPYERKIFQ